MAVNLMDLQAGTGTPATTPLTTEQFHDVLSILTSQLATLTLPPEAHDLLSRIDELNTQERKQARWGFVMIPHIIAYKYKPLLSDGAYAYYCWHLSIFGTKTCYYSLEQLGEKYCHATEVASRYRKAGETIQMKEACSHSVNAIRRYLRELQALKLIELEHRQRETKRGRKFGREITWLRATKLPWEENERYLTESHIMQRKNVSDSGTIIAFPTPTPSAPQPSARPSSSSTQGSSSTSSFFPSASTESDTSNGQLGSDSDRKSGVNVSDSDTQTKNQLRNQKSNGNQEQSISAGRLVPTEMIKDLGQRIALLAERYLGDLNAYDSEKKRKQAILDRQEDALLLAQICLQDGVEEQLIERVFRYAPESKTWSKYVESFVKKQLDFIPPMQVRFFTQLKYWRFKAILQEVQDINWLTPEEMEEVRKQDEEAHQAWLAEREQAQQEKQDTPDMVIPTPEEEEALRAADTYVTNATPGCDVPDEDTGVTAFSEPVTPLPPADNCYADVEGMRVLAAVHLLQVIRQHTPQLLQPRTCPAAQGTKVIEVVYEDKLWYFVDLEDYQVMREYVGLRRMPDALVRSLGLLGAYREQQDAPGQMSRSQRGLMNESYLAACKAKEAREKAAFGAL